ncbi:MAG: prolipoprotein diacylglyceryl transferase [Candidatus Azobacteroides sp.]|nr:prolipoprotein diacylglyceryl transferase [Candidatus Azobacteroides sp.]
MFLSIIWNVDPTLFTIGGLDIRWYGLSWILGLLIPVGIVYCTFKAEKIPDKLFDSLFIYFIIGLIVGARLGHCLFYDPEYYFSHPLEILKVWKGGLASHGSVLGILTAMALHRLIVGKPSVLWIMDRIAVPAGFTAAVIRLGNLMNSEIYGKPTDVPWGFEFVRDTQWYLSVASRGGGRLPCHPTQLYEALVYIVVFGITMWLYWKKGAGQKQGLLMGVVLVIVFVSRIFIESLKNVQEPFELAMRKTIGMDMGQILSIPFVILGGWLIWNALRKKPEPALETNTDNKSIINKIDTIKTRTLENKKQQEKVPVAGE